jgi:LacI family transcriptional regulator, repressor for deo operon, udp, cdd, tsx, nupC, and nupG
VSTIEDVADRAKVSVATVSRALRGLPNVAPSTRQRVLQAARELSYVADPSASRLASGRSRTIGLAVPMLGQWVYSKIYSGVEAVVAAAGYDALPFSMSGPGGVARFVESQPFRKRVDGLLLIDAPHDAEQMKRLREADVPLVTVGMSYEHVSSLTVDNRAAGRLAVGHLTGLGHQRIAFIGGMEDDPFDFAVPVDRYEGYLGALRSAGIELDPHLVVPGNFSLDGGAEAMHRLLELDHPPTAVFCCSDEMAIGAMQVARDAGLRVPEELSFVGFDDHDVSEYVGLTTIRQDVVGLGERGAELLLAVLQRPDGDVVHERHPVRLVVRRSTGPPPAGSDYRW